jgi:hypothetical protein
MSIEFYIPSFLAIFLGAVIMALGLKVMSQIEARQWSASKASSQSAISKAISSVISNKGHISNSSAKSVTKAAKGHYKKPNTALAFIVILLGVFVLLFGFTDLLFRFILGAGAIEYYTTIIFMYQ